MAFCYGDPIAGTPKAHEDIKEHRAFLLEDCMGTGYLAGRERLLPVMKPFETFRNWEIKYALTFTGLVVGTVALALTVYALFRKTAPNLRMEVVSVANVVDVKEDVGKLEVLYGGVNLRSNHQTLTVASLKVSNDGAAPIRMDDYDPSFPVGVEVANGKIAKAEPSDPSSKYLETHLANLQYSATRALIPPVIMEPGESFWLKLLVLHDQKTPFEIKPTGKIAGIKEFTFVALNAKAPSPSFLGIAFGGSTKVQLVRAVFYSILCGAVMLGLAAFDNWRERRKSRADRRQMLNKFRAMLSTPVNPDLEWVLSLYVRDGGWALAELLDLIQTPKETRQARKSLGFDMIPVIFSPNPSQRYLKF